MIETNKCIIIIYMITYPLLYLNFSTKTFLSAQNNPAASCISLMNIAKSLLQIKCSV